MSLALIDRAAQHPARTALAEHDGPACTYATLLARSATVAAALLDGRPSLAGERVAFLLPPGIPYVVTQWAIWRAGGIAVPLALSHPEPELQYALETVQASRIVALGGSLRQIQPLAERLGIPISEFGALEQGRAAILPEIDPQSAALILFTSGTTSRPKGVVLSHANLEAQMRILCEAWEWRPQDQILHVLPLHHVHGIVNVLLCALWAGACCVFLPRFDAGQVWRCFADPAFSLFMAVPTVYAKLVQHYEAQNPATQALLRGHARRFRLMVSGSAALPVSLMEAWAQISGQRLLERYGMTEIGMALSNPLHGARRAGSVGVPLPGVEVRLVDGDFQDVEAGAQGEIVVRGASVFQGYWQRPDATAAAFREGWFLTGDVAVQEGGYFRILGRSSVDILKSGGYKLSALEIEEIFREHAAVQDCAVLGLPDAEWGELVAMVVVCKAGALNAEELLAWGRGQMAHYKLPRRVLFVEELPRNAMGKVVKAELRGLF